MQSSVNAIILAGEGKDSRKICGESKRHLELNGTPLLVQLVRVLSQVEAVAGICIVGPKQPIQEILSANDVDALTSHIVVVSQRDNIYQNCEAGVSQFVPEYSDSNSVIDDEHLQMSFLLVPIDMPFVTTNEIEEFIDNSQQQNLDYAVGMTEELHLAMYYSTKSEPGLSLNYLHLKEGNFRLNNLHLIRPFQVANRQFIAKMYTRRHQSNFANVATTAYDFLVGERMGLGPVFFFIYLEILVLLNHLGLRSLVSKMKSRASKDRVAAYTSKLLQARVAIVETTIGGCAADIDSDEDYLAVQSRANEWQDVISQRTRTKSA